MLSGDEPREIAELMGFKTHSQETMSLLPQQFEDFVESFHGVSATKLVNQYNVPEHRANILMPTIVLYTELLKMVRPQSLLISPYGFAEGVILYKGAELENHHFLDVMREQNLQLARAIARSYQVDEAHVAQVERFTVQLCHNLADFDIDERMIFVLRTAIILSEVGKFVSLRNHSEHAYRIIMGTDLFGLSDREKEVVANVVFYHYKGKPDDDDENFHYLKEVQKILITKFVAILRCMRALDVSHKLKVSKLAIERNDKCIVVKATTKQDLSLEKWTFEREAEYFSEVFGLEMVLRIGGK